MDPIEMLMELFGVPRKRSQDPSQFSDDAERERLAAAEADPRGIRSPMIGGGQLAVRPDPETDDLMALLSRIQQEEAVSDPLDPVTALGGAQLRRDLAVQDLNRLEAEYERRFGPAPPPTDQGQAATLSRAQAQARPVGVVPQLESALGLAQGQDLARVGPRDQGQGQGRSQAQSQARPPSQVQAAQVTQQARPGRTSIGTPRGGPQETAPIDPPPNIDLNKIFSEVVENLRSEGPILRALPGGVPSPRPTSPGPAPRPGIQARAAAATAAPPPPAFPGVQAPPGQVAPPAFPGVFAPPSAQITPPIPPSQHFPFPYQPGPGEVAASSPVQPSPVQIGAGFQPGPGPRPSPSPAPTQSDLLNQVEAQRIRERGGPTNVPFDQGLPGLPSDQMPGPVPVPTAPPLRSSPKPGAIPPEVPNSSVQKPKPQVGMGTEAPDNLKEALLLEALRLSQKRRSGQAQPVGAQ